MFEDDLISDLNGLVSRTLDKILEENQFSNDLVADDSDYTVVDGEEGDYGVIRYYDNKGVLIITFINRSGDDTDYELTPEGKDYIYNKLLSKFNNAMIDNFKSDNYF